jgi:hypothetical protein
MYNNRILFNIVKTSMTLNFRSVTAILLSLLLCGCSIFTPVMLEQHQWGSLTIHEGYRSISQEHSDVSWSLTYELATQNTFSGLVRHTSRINENQYPMLTHDILVTSGDYADSSLVRTSVMNHHFTWSSKTSDWPKGSINLLHTMPKNEEMVNALYSIKYGDIVKITGYEIYTINRYKDGSYRGQWKDSGCNTLLVTAVEILESP